MKEMIIFLQEQPLDILEYNENLVRRLLQKITVYEGKCVVEFKSGLEVEIEI